MKKRPIIVAYDISRNKIRTRVRKILKEWRLDNQKSLYECRLTNRQAEELFLQLSENLDHKTDKLLMAWLEPHRNLLYRGIGRDRINKKLWVFR
ncbi:MAG: CRISPR-associated endonuclease Cas2 [Desulfobacula sp.]|nr:CRISPR-associated endonuclease Cas2 [Desulfobacula sp.]